MDECLRKLYIYAYDKQIHFVSMTFSRSKKAACAEHDGNQTIIMDNRNIISEKEEKELLAEELGHLETGALYFIQDYTNPNYWENVRRAEAKALRWKIKKLIPRDELDRAVAGGSIELWELADRFNVPQDLVAKAVEYYKGA